MIAASRRVPPNPAAAQVVDDDLLLVTRCCTTQVSVHQTGGLRMTWKPAPAGGVPLGGADGSAPPRAQDGARGLVVELVADGSQEFGLRAEWSEASKKGGGR